MPELEAALNALLDAVAELQYAAVWCVRAALAAVLLVIGLSVAGALWWPGKGKD